MGMLHGQTAEMIKGAAADWKQRRKAKEGGDVRAANISKTHKEILKEAQNIRSRHPEFSTRAVAMELAKNHPYSIGHLSRLIRQKR
jgi:hypothetical protein